MVVAVVVASMLMFFLPAIEARCRLYVIKEVGEDGEDIRVLGPQERVWPWERDHGTKRKTSSLVFAHAKGQSQVFFSFFVSLFLSLFFSCFFLSFDFLTHPFLAGKRRKNQNKTVFEVKHSLKLENKYSFLQHNHNFFFS